MTHKAVGNSKKVNNPERSFQINSVPFLLSSQLASKSRIFRIGALGLKWR